GPDRVGREALAVVDVVDLDPLVLADAGDVEQAAVDRARAFVVRLGVGHRGAVDLGVEQGQLHGVTGRFTAGGGSFRGNRKVWAVAGAAQQKRSGRSAAVDAVIEREIVDQPRGT